MVTWSHVVTWSADHELYPELEAGDNFSTRPANLGRLYTLPLLQDPPCSEVAPHRGELFSTHAGTGSVERLRGHQAAAESLRSRKPRPVF